MDDPPRAASNDGNGAAASSGLRSAASLEACHEGESPKTNTLRRGISTIQAKFEELNSGLLDQINKGLVRPGGEAVKDVTYYAPQAVVGALSTLKDLKQSSLEVIRLESAEVQLATLPTEAQTSLVLRISICLLIGGKCIRFGKKQQLHVVDVKLSSSRTRPGVMRSGPLQIKNDLSVNSSLRRAGAIRFCMYLKGRSKTQRKFVDVTLPSCRIASTELVEVTAQEKSKSGGTPGMGAQAKLKFCVKANSQVFDIGRCQPRKVKYTNLNEWRPASQRQWKDVWWSPFREKDISNWAEVLGHMQADMKRGCILLYQTLFAQSEKLAQPRPAWRHNEEPEFNFRIMFLKRLVVCLAACDLKYSKEENGHFARDWVFPIASAITFGGRILIRLDGVNWQEFVNFLLFGDVKGFDWFKDGGEKLSVPSPFYARWAATHAVGLVQEHCQLYERKLTTRNAVENVRAGMKSHHLGMDLPVGGLGNPAPDTLSSTYGGLFIGQAGVPFRSDYQYVAEVQHGHLYMRWDDFGVQSTPVLCHESNAAEADGTERIAMSRNLSIGSSTSSVTATDTTGGDVCEMKAGKANSLFDEWVQLPHVYKREDLKEILEANDLGHVADEKPASFAQLYRAVAEENLLAIQRHDSGILRCRGVLIHLVVTHEKDGVTMVLVHSKATAKAGETSAEIEDCRVPMTLRYRHESWTDAVSRICQTNLQLGVQAVTAAIAACRLAQEEMCIYRCRPPPTLCYHSEVPNLDDVIPTEYQAYRFQLHIQKKVEALFTPILSGQQENLGFERESVDRMLSGFGGLPNPSRGSLTSKWVWMPMDDAIALGVDGLVPPEDRLQIVHEQSHLSSILVGIEGSAPQKESFFGGKHGTSGLSKDFTPFGTRKWRDYRRGGQDVPADIGGTRLHVDVTGFTLLQEAVGRLWMSVPSEAYSGNAEAKAEREFFRELLQASNVESAKIIETRTNFIRPVLHSAAGTMVFDGCVRTRTTQTLKSGRSPSIVSADTVPSARPTGNSTTLSL
eukprot:TRINITY_DN7499_c0_g1_i1.p1 TRINITY_DN7499_c0_g1~~TRINITY_DN7499_c0_g1_i1.p1  ORF type:complete len:1017 (-),score=156.65 TRINITY_DN7499_c0_g1_i1:112-3162(-)